MIARNALIIDDSKSARFALRRYLEGYRYEVEAVETADEAYRMLEARSSGVVFLDHVMPGVDGFEVLRTLRAKPATANLPVVICSSNEGAEFNEQARAHGASAVLQKPPNPDQLRRILDALERGENLIEAVGAAAPAAPAASTADVLDLRLNSVNQPFQSHAPNSTVAGTAIAPAREGASLAVKAGDDALREQLDHRLKKVSQGLLVQFAEIKATVAHLANQQARLAEQPAGVRSELRTELRSGLEETNQALRLVTSRIEGIEREVFSQLTAMRTHMDATVKAQNDRLTEMVQFARQTAAEEAQVVAERTVMTAALRISDQLADAILGAVGRK